jgi:hypothetical protein
MNDELIRFREINGQYQSWRLLYRASRDGFSSESFHEFCNGEANTLTVIQSANSKVFGGFTGASWSKSSGFKEDPYAFIFTLLNEQRRQKVLKCTEPLNAIYCNQNYGPCFGNDDIKISNMPNTNQNSSSTVGFSYGEGIVKYGSEESKTLLAGEQNFQVVEVEVFTKNYSNLNNVH